MSAPADDLVSRLRADADSWGPYNRSGLEAAQLEREAADQLERNEEHYQAAMTMGEKHRKNWVEACQRVDALEKAVAAAMPLRNFVAACAQEHQYDADADLDTLRAFDEARAAALSKT